MPGFSSSWQRHGVLNRKRVPRLYDEGASTSAMVAAKSVIIPVLPTSLFGGQQGAIPLRTTRGNATWKNNDDKYSDGACRSISRKWRNGLNNLLQPRSSRRRPLPRSKRPFCDRISFDYFDFDDGMNLPCCRVPGMMKSIAAEVHIFTSSLSKTSSLGASLKMCAMP
jgi:hypothetical protein